MNKITPSFTSSWGKPSPSQITKTKFNPVYKTAVPNANIGDSIKFGTQHIYRNYPMRDNQERQVIIIELPDAEEKSYKYGKSGQLNKDTHLYEFPLYDLKMSEEVGVICAEPSTFNPSYPIWSSYKLKNSSEIIKLRKSYT